MSSARRISGAVIMPALVLIAGLVCVPDCAATQAAKRPRIARRQTAASPSKARTAPQPLKFDATTEELKRRYDRLSKAAAIGDPESVIEASKKLAALGLRLMANLRMMVGAYPQAAELYRQSVGLEDAPDTRMNLAVAALRTSQPDEALAQTAKVLDANPKDARAWHVNGKAWLAKENYRVAADSLVRSLALKSDVNVQYALGFALLKAGERGKADEIFRQMLEEYGDRAIWHVVFAGAYRDSDYPEEAIREFKRAIAMDTTVDHAHFHLGQTLLEQNRYAQTDESMAEFREAVRQHPNDFFANYYLGMGESQLNEFEASNRHLSLASQLRPDVSDLWLFLGLNNFQQNNYDAARTYLLKATALTPREEESRNNYQIRRAYILLGRIAFMRGNKEEADKYVQRAKEMQAKSLQLSADVIADTIAAGGMGAAPAVMPRVKMPEQEVLTEDAPVNPTAPVDPTVLAKAPLPRAEQQQLTVVEKQLRAVLSSAYNDWGTAEAKQGLFYHALERFGAAEQWDNTTAGLMRNIGLAALRVDNRKEAIRAFGIAVETDPQDRMARARLAMTLFKTDQYGEAAKQFEALGTPVFSDAGMAYAYGYSLVQLNQERKAGEVLNRLSTLSVPAELLLSIGDLYSVLQDYEHAVSSYRRALQLDPAIPRARYKMGAALLRLDRPVDAIPELQAELKISPDDADVQYNLAYALLQTSQKEQAATLLRELIASHPEHPQAQYQMGKMLLDGGQLEEAVQHLEVAARLDPARDYVHYQLQTAYRRAGRREDADREARIYREIKDRKRREVVIPQPEHKQ